MTSSILEYTLRCRAKSYAVWLVPQLVRISRQGTDTMCRTKESAHNPLMALAFFCAQLVLLPPRGHAVDMLTDEQPYSRQTTP